MSKKSDSVARSLQIIKDNPGIKPAWFARLYFPRSHPGWSRRCKAGPKGTSTGTGLTLWSGGWLGKLRKLGLINYDNRLTQDGRAYISATRGSDGEDEERSG